MNSCDVKTIATLKDRLAMVLFSAASLIPQQLNRTVVLAVCRRERFLGAKRRFWLMRVRQTHGFRWLFSDFWPVLRRKSSPTVPLRQAAREERHFMLALLFAHILPGGGIGISRKLEYGKRYRPGGPKWNAGAGAEFLSLW